MSEIKTGDSVTINGNGMNQIFVILDYYLNEDRKHYNIDVSHPDIEGLNFTLIGSGDNWKIEGSDKEYQFIFSKSILSDDYKIELPIEKCSTKYDLNTMDDWDEKEPTIFINFHREGQKDVFHCYDADSLQEWLGQQDTVMADWVQKDPFIPVDNVG